MTGSSQSESSASLSPTNVEAFLDRYQHFFDGLMREVRVQFGRSRDGQQGQEPHGVLVECSVIDSQSPSPESWMDIMLDVEEVSAMRLIRGNESWAVLSGGLSIGFFNDEVYLAFDDQVTTREDFMGTRFLIVGKRCTWSTISYRE